MGVLTAGPESWCPARRAGAGTDTKSSGKDPRVRDGLLYMVHIHCNSPLFCALQSEEQQERLQQGQATRLAEIELLLNTLAAKTQVCSAGSLPPPEEQTNCRCCKSLIEYCMYVLYGIIE